MKMATLKDVMERATSRHIFHASLEVLLSLDKVDWYVSDLLTEPYRAGASTLFTTLMALAQALHEDDGDVSYLEIGVRKGFSLALFAHECQAAELTGVDLWAKEYAGEDNPGAAFVQRQLARVGHKGRATLHKGSSHELLETLLCDEIYTVITVDGDHTLAGARADLTWAIEHLAPEGFVLLDDIANPAHLYLDDLWQELIDPVNFVAWQYNATPNGIAIAQRIT